jgi:predicted RNA-binding Zn ribbon-like protein
MTVGRLCYHQHVSAIEFPVLGEPPAVEFANTLYRSGEEVVDYLATPALVSGWFAAAAQPAPVSWSDDELGRLRELRDAVHDVLTAEVDAARPRAASLAAINRCLAAAPVRWTLGWGPGQGMVAGTELSASGVPEVLGRLALGCVESLAGSPASRVRRCEGPGCSMFFVKNHSRRRWCHDSCGHRARQSRYYRRHRPGAEGSPFPQEPR